MTEQEFDGWVRRHRFLYHVTARGSWSSISKHGLLTTNGLLNESSVSSTERRCISRSHRGSCKTVHGRKRDGIRLEAVIRDQNALVKQGNRLKKELDAQNASISLECWYERQNARVFFYPSKREAVNFANKYANDDCPQDILVVCTRSLVDIYSSRIELCAFNSGATNRSGLRPTCYCGKWHDRLFESVKDYPYARWSKNKKRHRVVREFTICGRICDIDDHVVDFL